MATASAKAYKGMGMEGFVAKWYATNTLKALKDFQELAERIAAQLPSGSSVLEVAPGPGYFAIELGKRGSYQIKGLDISKTFVEIARQNAAEAKVSVDFQLGNASQMPFNNDSFDFLLCRAAFKNFSDPVGALREMHRVLKPGSKGLIIDLRKDASMKSISQYIDSVGVGAANALLMKLTFRFMLLKRAYTKPDFERFFSGIGFRSVNIPENPIGFEIEFVK